MQQQRTAHCIIMMCDYCTYMVHIQCYVVVGHWPSLFDVLFLPLEEVFLVDTACISGSIRGLLYACFVGHNMPVVQQAALMTLWMVCQPLITGSAWSETHGCRAGMEQGSGGGCCTCDHIVLKHLIDTARIPGGCGGSVFACGVGRTMEGCAASSTGV